MNDTKRLRAKKDPKKMKSTRYMLATAELLFNSGCMLGSTLSCAEYQITIHLRVQTRSKESTAVGKVSKFQDGFSQALGVGYSPIMNVPLHWVIPSLSSPSS